MRKKRLSLLEYQENDVKVTLDDEIFMEGVTESIKSIAKSASEMNLTLFSEDCHVSSSRKSEREY